MALNDLRKIKFTYKENERLFTVSEAAPLEECIRQVKVNFKIPDDTPLSFINIDDDNSILIPSLTAHFWVNSVMDTPRYRITTLESKKNIYYF